MLFSNSNYAKLLLGCQAFTVVKASKYLVKPWFCVAVDFCIPAKLVAQTPLRDGLRLAGAGVCRNHQSVCPISLRKRSISFIPYFPTAWRAFNHCFGFLNIIIDALRHLVTAYMLMAKLINKELQKSFFPSDIMKKISSIPWSRNYFGNFCSGCLSSFA